MPAVHDWHDGSPFFELYVPGVQFVHTTDDGGLYVPSGHIVHSIDEMVE